MSCPEPSASNESSEALQHSSTPSYRAPVPSDHSCISVAQIPLPEGSEDHRNCTKTGPGISDNQTPLKVWSRAVLESLSNQEMRAENTEDTSSTVYQSNSHMLALVEKISQEVLRKQTALDRSAVALHQESDLASTNELSPDEDNEGNGAVDTVRTTSKTSESSREDSDLNKAISISTTNDDKAKTDESLHRKSEKAQPHKEQRQRLRNASRRKTLATLSPLNECPKYASELEKEAFSKIRDWKAEFALKLDNVLGQKNQQIEKAKGKRTARVISVPMGLSRDELNSIHSNMLGELRRKSLSGALLTDQKEHTPKQHLKIPTVPFPKRPSADISPQDLQSALIKELKGLSTSGGKKETSVLPTNALQHLKRQSNFQDHEKDVAGERLPQQVPHVPHSETGFAHPPLFNVSTPYHPVYYYPPSPGLWPSLDPQRMAELIRWHDQQREKLAKELQGLQPSTGKGEAALSSTVFGGNNLERVLRSLQDVLDCIFSEAITTLGNFERTKSKKNGDTQTAKCQRQQNQSDSLPLTKLSNSSIKQLTDEASEKYFEEISSSSSSSYSSLIAGIENAVMLKEEADTSGESGGNWNDSLHDSIWHSTEINNTEYFDLVTRRLPSDQSFVLGYSSSEHSPIVSESEEKHWASDIEQECLLPEMLHVSGSNGGFISYSGNEQAEGGNWDQENFGGIMESIQDINMTNQAHHLVAGLTTDQTSPGDEDELTKTNSKTGVVLVHQKQTPHPAVTENLEEPGIDHQPQLEEDPQSVNVNRYQLCGEEAFVIQPEPAVTSEENAPEKAPTPLKAHDIQSSSRETLHVDKMLTERLDEDKIENVSEEYVSKVTWREDDRNGPSSIWLHEEEEPSDTWSDTSLDNESEEEREDTIYGESKGKEKGSERKEEEYEDWREGQSIQVANISDCPLNDMERIRIQNVFLKEELASLQKGLFTKQKLLENKVKEAKQLRSSMEKLRSYRDLFNESRDQITEIGLERDELQRRIAQCVREKEELQTGLTHASNEITKTKQKMSEVCLENEELQKRITRVSSEKQASLHELDFLRSQHKALGQNLDGLNKTWRQKCARLSSEISAKKEELTKLKKDSVSSSQRTKELFLELDAYRGRMESKDTQIGLLKSAVRDIEKDNKRLKHERLSIDSNFCHMTEEKSKTATDAKDRCIILEKKLFASESQCKALKQQMFYWSEVWKRECERLSDENREIQINHEKMRKDNDKLTEDNKLAKLELTSFKQREETEYSRVSDLQSTIKKIENEMKNLRSKNGKLESNILKLENEKLGKTKDLEDKESTIAFLRNKVREQECEMESPPTVTEPVQKRPQLQRGPVVIESIIEKENLQERTGKPEDPEQNDLEQRERESQIETKANDIPDKTTDTKIKHCKKTEIREQELEKESPPTVKEPFQRRPHLQKGPVVIESIIEKDNLRQGTSSPEDPEQKELEQRERESQIKAEGNYIQDKTTDTKIKHCRKTEVQCALQENEIPLKEMVKIFFEQYQSEKIISDAKHRKARKQEIRSVKASTHTRAHEEMLIELMQVEKENNLATGKKLDSMKHEVEEAKQITLDLLKHQAKQTQMTKHNLEGIKCMVQVTQERLDYLRNDKVQNGAILRATQVDGMDEIKKELQNLQLSVKELLHRKTESNSCGVDREAYAVSLEASQTLVQRMKEMHDEYCASKEKELECLKSWVNEQLRIKEYEAESINTKKEELETRLQRFMMNSEKSLQNQKENFSNIAGYLGTFFTEIHCTLNAAVGQVSKNQQQLQANLLDLKAVIEDKSNESGEANCQLEHLQSVIITNNRKLESLQKEVSRASEVLVKSDCTSLRQLLQFQTNQSRDLGCILRDTFSQDLRKMADLKSILKESFNNINRKLDQMWNGMHEIKQMEEKERQVLDKCIQTKLEKTAMDMKAVTTATKPLCDNTEPAKEEDNKKDIVRYCNSCHVIRERKEQHIAVLDRRIRDLEKALDHSKTVKKLEIETLRELSKRELDVKDIEITNLRSEALELSLRLNKFGVNNRDTGQYGLESTHTDEHCKC